jgi:transcriptional regulator with GAF, ATPase, and Fis domain
VTQRVPIATVAAELSAVAASHHGHGGLDAGHGFGHNSAVAAPAPAPIAPVAPAPAPAADAGVPAFASERERLIWAMEQCGWVQAKAARLLNLTPRQIGYALQKYNIPLKRL